MDSPALLAAQHMAVTRESLDKIAHNLANMSTPGYQADDTLVTEDKTSPNFQDSLSFAISSKNIRDTTPGSFMPTGNSLDIALATPDVYFSVKSADGENFYTRSGGMELNKDGHLIQSGSGLPLTDSSHSPIKIPTGTRDIQIAGDGTISADGHMVAQIGVFKFENSQTLTKIADTLMKATDEPKKAEKISIMQHGYEGSNVNSVLALAQMIELQKHDAQDAFVISTYKEQSGQQLDDLLKPLNV